MVAACAVGGAVAKFSTVKHLRPSCHRVLKLSYLACVRELSGFLRRNSGSHQSIRYI